MMLIMGLGGARLLLTGPLLGVSHMYPIFLNPACSNVLHLSFFKGIAHLFYP